MNDSEQMVGVLVGNTGGTMLDCILRGPYEVKRGEFLRVPHKESGQSEPTWAICRVYKITRNSALFSDTIIDTTSLGASRWIPESVSDSIKASLELVGFVNPESGALSQARVPLKPGAPVYKITRNIIQEVMGYNPGTSIELGRLVGYESGPGTIPVLLDINTLVTEHLAILAMTGAGKSYAVGRIIELILTQANARIIVLDPHGEYGNCIAKGKLNTVNPSSIPDKKYRSAIKKTSQKLSEMSVAGGGFQAFAPASRAADRKYGKSGFTPLYLRLDRLPEEALANLLPEMSEPQHRVLGVALKKWFDEYPEPRNPLDLIRLLTSSFSELKKSASEGTESAIGSRSASIVGLRLKELIEDTNIFYVGTGKPTTIEDILGITKSKSVGRAAIIDFMSMPNEHAQIAVSVIMSELLDKSKSNRAAIPETFIVVEEAHNFTPRTGHPISKQIITRIASEGRKFGLGLCVVSQRPSKLDADVLSQCNSFIILRIKNPGDRSFVESVAEYASRTDLEQIAALATGEGLVFGRAFPFTVLTKIGPRAIEHGGTTPDVISSWRE